MLARPVSRQLAARARGGFTLLEVLVVVAILVILASVATFATVSYLTQAKIDQATLKAQKIQTQAKSFYTKSSGVWPSSLQDLIISQGPGVPPLLDGGEADITDPWGNPYQFSIDLNQSGVETFYVFTQSPDGAPIRVPQN